MALIAVIDSWETFFTTVENMRIWQKRYFSTRSQAALLESKLLEKAIDDFIKGRNERIAKKVQPEIFKEGN